MSPPCRLCDVVFLSSASCSNVHPGRRYRKADCKVVLKALVGQGGECRLSIKHGFFRPRVRAQTPTRSFGLGLHSPAMIVLQSVLTRSFTSSALDLARETGADPLGDSIGDFSVAGRFLESSPPGDSSRLRLLGVAVDERSMSIGIGWWLIAQKNWNSSDS